ncbi:MAG: redoxin domain-containing protein [Chloroflexota bacterium]
MKLRVGDLAPDISAATPEGERVRLSDYRGRWVVLVFLRWLG